MAFDAHSNLALAKIVTAPSPATSGTSLTIDAAFVSLFPATPFNCTVYPANLPPTNANAEIVRVTNITSNTFTIVRAQEGTTAKAIAAGWLIANTISKKVITDIESAVVISAGTQSYQGPFTLSNSNGVSFGMSNGTVTASVAGGGVAISGGTNSQATGTVQFSNSNGVTFGLDGAGVMTASHNGLTSQSNQAVSASNGSFTFQTLNFSNANNVTFGTSAGGIITASVVPGGGGGSVNFSAGTTSNNLTNIVFSNSNNVTFGLNGSTITATATVAPQQAISEINAGTQQAIQGVSFANSNGITFGMSGSMTITASHNGLTSQSNQAFSADGGSSAFQTLVFANSNGVSFSNSNGSVVASVGAGVGAGSISAGTTSVALGQVVFSNSNNVSFGLNGSTVTASAAGGAGSDVTLNGTQVGIQNMEFSAIHSQGIATFFPVEVGNYIQFDRLCVKCSQKPGFTLTGTCSSTMAFGIYTSNGSTLSLVFSTGTDGTFNYAGALTNGFVGIRDLTYSLNATTLPPDNYYFALLFSYTQSSHAFFPGIMYAGAGVLEFSGPFGGATNASQQKQLGLGIFNSAITALPSSVQFDSLSGAASQYQRIPAMEIRYGTV